MFALNKNVLNRFRFRLNGFINSIEGKSADIYESDHTHDSLDGVAKNIIAGVQFENRSAGWNGQKMIRADSESSIFRHAERACNGKYASTFLFRSRGTLILPALNIHVILLTTFQTSLSPETPFIFLDLCCFRSPDPSS